MALIESEAEAIAWVHQMAKTPTPGDHEVAEPHPYCLGDDPCCCVQLIAAEQTARADERVKAAERVRVEALREAREAVLASYPCSCEFAHWHHVACNSRWAVPAIAAIDRLIDAATTGDTDD